MTDQHNAVSARARALREDFDLGFAAPPAAEDAFENMLAIRAGGEAYAVALSEVHGLFVDRKVVALPARPTEFLGITCLRSGIVAVYGLGAVLGHAPADAPMRWLLSAGPFALAFERFDAFARIARSELSGALAAGRGGHVPGSAMIAGERRSIISLRAILQTVSTIA